MSEITIYNFISMDVVWIKAITMEYNPNVSINRLKSVFFQANKMLYLKLIYQKDQIYLFWIIDASAGRDQLKNRSFLIKNKPHTFK